MESVDTFFESIKKAACQYFSNSSIKYILRTDKSLKLNILIEEDIFIAIRYNSRNGRKDFAVSRRRRLLLALISQNNRIFGYDNLKTWHYHPVSNPEEHISCDEPTVDKVISDMKRIFENRNARRC